MERRLRKLLGRRSADRVRVGDRRCESSHSAVACRTWRRILTTKEPRSLHSSSQGRQHRSNRTMKHGPSMRFVTCLTCLVPCFDDLSCSESCALRGVVGDGRTFVCSRVRVVGCWAALFSLGCGGLGSRGVCGAKRCGAVRCGENERALESYCDCCRIVTRSRVTARG